MFINLSSPLLHGGGVAKYKVKCSRVRDENSKISRGGLV
jgi:hypothetical protein